MSHRNIEEMTEKAKEILKLTQELEKMAEENSFGLNVYSDQINFEDWLSSDCFGEGNSEEFGVGADGHIWHSSSC